ncbi:hypothetical protein BD408DRAFT_409822 [Parasitella parasitica]|nr:hypothetical protein BD408DRAFT_409822 [Parasitella parasitica]
MGRLESLHLHSPRCFPSLTYCTDQKCIYWLLDLLFALYALCHFHLRCLLSRCRCRKYFYNYFLRHCRLCHHRFRYSLRHLKTAFHSLLALGRHQFHHH